VSDVDPLAPLRQRFLERARVEAGVIEQALAEGDHAALETTAHSLAGSAGLFGFSDIGRAASEIDSLYASGDQPSEAQVRALLAAMQAAYS
jgi:HPt (histidine-containing phosphotransfer) domain-containing protein